MENSDERTHGTYLHSEHGEPYGHYGHGFADYRDFRHNPAVQWVKEHPLIVVAAAAVVIAVGPRRIGRGLARSGSKLTALTLRNQSNVDIAGRLLSTVFDYMRRNRTRYR